MTKVNNVRAEVNSYQTEALGHIKDQMLVQRHKDHVKRQVNPKTPNKKIP